MGINSNIMHNIIICSQVVRGYEVLHLSLLHSSVVPPPPLCQLSGKLAGEPTDLLSLRSKTAAFSVGSTRNTFTCCFSDVVVL